VNKQSAKIASLVVAAAAFSMISLAGPTWGGASKPSQESLAFSTPLPNVPGKNLHHHTGSVYACVLTGAIRSENSAAGPEREYKAGESFFEPPGSVHLVTANASETEAASLLAFFIVDDGATLKFRVLLTASLVSSIIMFCSNIVAVSLPSIGQSLEASFADVQWLISAYLLNLISERETAPMRAEAPARRRVN
jgi:hypothetical protein